MSRANASKSGMLPGSSSLMSSSDASLADILELAEAAGEGGGGGGWSVVCGVLLWVEIALLTKCDVIFSSGRYLPGRVLY